MSLFDCMSDEDYSGSGSGGSDGSSDEKCPAPAAAGSAPVAAAAPLSRLGVPSRFTLSAEDDQRARDQRRKDALGKFSVGQNGGRAQTQQPGSGQSVFANSISEALRKRREDQESVVLTRIQKQRQLESMDESLVARDREVGVFVTPAYRQMLEEKKQKQRETMSSKKGSRDEGLNSNKTMNQKGDGHLNGDDDDDDDMEADPLDGFIQMLESKGADKPMGELLWGSVNEDGEVNFEESFQPEEADAQDGTHDEENLIGTNTMNDDNNDNDKNANGNEEGEVNLTVATGESHHDVSSKCDANIAKVDSGSSNASAAESNLRDVNFKYRESRKRMRMSRDDMIAAARRFEERAVARIHGY